MIKSAQPNQPSELAQSLRNGPLTPELAAEAATVVERLRKRVGWLVKMVASLEETMAEEQPDKAKIWGLCKHIRGIERARREEDRANRDTLNKLRVRATEAEYALSQSQARVGELGFKNSRLEAENLALKQESERLKQLTPPLVEGYSPI